MIPTFRAGTRAIGLSGWLAACHSDKYNTFKTLDTPQPGTPTGLYSTGSSIWSTNVPEEPFQSPFAPSTRAGFSELMNSGLGTIPPPSHPNQPFNYPPAVTNNTQVNSGADMIMEELSALTLDPIGNAAEEAMLDPSVDPLLLEAMISSQAQQAAELQQRDMLDMGAWANSQVPSDTPLQFQQQQQSPAFNNDPSSYCCDTRDNCSHYVSSVMGPQGRPSLSDMYLGKTESSAHSPESLLHSAVKDPGKYLSHLGSLAFPHLCEAVQKHLYSVGPVPDMTLFHLFRKVRTQEEADKAVAILMDDRSCRLSRGVIQPYDEVTSAALFNALNRAGGDEFVVAAAEKAVQLGLTLSRSNMYHLMKQYSVQGKVALVERLFRSLEMAGKSWNSNCVVIMMLAYFNQGKFEEADLLRRELKARGIRISERIDSRLDKLLSGEESWLWEDKVWARPRRTGHPVVRGLSSLTQNQFSRTPHVGLFGSQYLAPTQPQQQQRMSFHTSPVVESWPAIKEVLDDDTFPSEPPHKGEPGTMEEAISEPRQHLTLLRMSGFDELCSALEQAIEVSGPVENVCISFLFRKVETRREVEKAMKLLEKDREARKKLGLVEEYNETTCSRIFNALFRADAADLALEYAGAAKQSGLLLSGKALHELLKSFAIRNDVDKVKDIWQLVKTHGKPSSRIVYSIFRTYFDNNMMKEAQAFKDEITEMGINLSASATRNIEEVLSGTKQWVKDPRDV
ncbi:hypothetical protein BSKO_08938 [Bryopsis sp. KO-2023]|nr:hypothetical protein BSKO_08938 [Bryopsis sp. KO-2023]